MIAAATLCTVAKFPAHEETQHGVTYAQAMEMFERFCMADRMQAVPTIAHEMGIPYETCCQVIGGNIWPGAYRYWSDLVWP
jgi:hypothetical protein